MIRFGTYTRYRGNDLRLIEENDFFKLVYNGRNCPIEGFKNHTDQIAYLNVPKSEINNAYFVNTFCIFKGFKFDVSTVIGEDKIGIVTNNKEAHEKLKLEVRDRGVFQKEIKLTEVEKLWEERKQSIYGLKIPDGLELYFEIEIPKKKLSI